MPLNITLGDVERFCFRSKSWESCPRMMENRGSHGLTAIGDSLYAIGGGGLHSNLSNNEKLVCTKSGSDAGKWEAIASMPTARHALAVISVNTVIYAIGGWIDGTICSADVEMYDSATDQWTICSKLHVPRRLLGVAAFGHHQIFAFGGTIDYEGHYTNAVEVYDTVADEWTQRRGLPTAGEVDLIDASLVNC